MQTNLPDNFQFYGKLNYSVPFSKVVVKSGYATIPLLTEKFDVKSLDIYSVLATVSGVDLSIVGDRCRNLVGRYVKFDPICGNSIEYHYKADSPL